MASAAIFWVSVASLRWSSPNVFPVHPALVGDLGRTSSRFMRSWMFLSTELGRDAGRVHDPVVAAHLRVRGLGRVAPQVVVMISLSSAVLSNMWPAAKASVRKWPAAASMNRACSKSESWARPGSDPVLRRALLGQLERLDVHLAPAACGCPG